MKRIRVAVNSDFVIAKRVADLLRLQDDMRLAAALEVAAKTACRLTSSGSWCMPASVHAIHPDPKARRLVDVRR
jgi:hypothetical protein